MLLTYQCLKCGGKFTAFQGSRRKICSMCRSEQNAQNSKGFGRPKGSTDTYKRTRKKKDENKPDNLIKTT